MRVILTFLVLLGLTCGPSVAQTVAEKEAAGKTVTLSSIARPLRLVLADVSRQSGSRFYIADNLREKKLICLVENQSEAALVSALATVTGADVKATMQNGVKTYTLTQNAEVRKWLRAYETKRTATRQAAADDLSKRLFQRIQEQRVMSEPAPDVYSGGESGAKLMRLLPEAALQNLATTFALQKVGLRELSEGAAFTLPNGSITKEMRDISSKISQNMSEWTRPHFDPQAPLVATLHLYHGAQPMIRIGNVGFTGLLPFRAVLFPRLPMDVEMGEEVKFEALFSFAKVARNSAPASALLGFLLNANGECADSVAVTDREPKARENAGTDSFSPAKFFQDLHERFGVPVVADYYTESRRVRDLPAAFPARLRLAAGAFARVFRERDGLLLSRTVDFAERDRREANYPIFERCIAFREQTASAKEKGVGELTPEQAGAIFSIRDARLLPLNWVLELCGLPHDQFVHLLRYADFETGAVFSDLARLERPRNNPLPLYKFWARFAPFLSSLQTPQGMLLSSMPRELQETILEDTSIKLPLASQVYSGDTLLRSARLVLQQRDKGAGQDLVFLLPDKDHKGIVVEILPASAPVREKAR